MLRAPLDDGGPDALASDAEGAGEEESDGKRDGVEEGDAPPLADGEPDGDVDAQAEFELSPAEADAEGVTDAE